METIYDWTTLALFCALAVLFLERSMGAVVPNDRPILYLPPALGCMVANGLGNAGHDVVAIVLILATLGYSGLVLKPWIRAG